LATAPLSAEISALNSINKMPLSMVFDVNNDLMCNIRPLKGAIVVKVYKKTF
jgi:hypothetical protein